MPDAKLFSIKDAGRLLMMDQSMIFNRADVDILAEWKLYRFSKYDRGLVARGLLGYTGILYLLRYDLYMFSFIKSDGLCPKNALKAAL